MRRLKGNLEVRQEELRKLREMNEARDAEVAQLKVEEEQMRLREEELVTMVAGLELQVDPSFPIRGVHRNFSRGLGLNCLTLLGVSAPVGAWKPHWNYNCY